MNVKINFNDEVINMNKELTESEIKALAPDWATHYNHEYWLNANVIKFYNGYRVAIYNVDQGRMLNALLKGTIAVTAKPLHATPESEVNNKPCQ